MEEDAIENIRTMHVTNNGLAAIISANRKTIERQKQSIHNIQREIRKINTDIDNLEARHSRQAELIEKASQENDTENQQVQK